MTPRDLLALLLRFVSGEAASERDADAIESAALELATRFPQLDELADDIASYSPAAQPLLYDHSRMTCLLQRHIDFLRAVVDDPQ